MGVAVTSEDGRHIVTSNLYVCPSGYEPIPSQSECQNALDNLGIISQRNSGEVFVQGTGDPGDPQACWADTADFVDYLRVYWNPGGTTTGARSRRNVICQETVTAPAGYDVIRPGAISGRNIILHHGTSVGQWAALCNADANCLAFEYGVDYGTSNSYKPGDCQLQSASGPVIDGTGYNLDLYVKVTPAPTPAPTASCPETCYSHTCDFWGQYGYSCSVLSSTYRCDCSGCSCSLAII